MPGGGWEPAFLALIQGRKHGKLAFLSFSLSQYVRLSISVVAMEMEGVPRFKKKWRE
jgi:hypothetical protein